MEGTVLRGLIDIGVFEYSLPSWAASTVFVTVEDSDARVETYLKALKNNTETNPSPTEEVHPTLDFLLWEKMFFFYFWFEWWFLPDCAGWSFKTADHGKQSSRSLSINKTALTFEKLTQKVSTHYRDYPIHAISKWCYYICGSFFYTITKKKQIVSL